MTYILRNWAVWSALLLLIACKESTPGNETTPPTNSGVSYQITEPFPGLQFSSPVEMAHAGDGSNRLFVVEQNGTIRFFNPTQNPSTANVFLDIRSKVISGGEQGLLGLAFHPDFKTNGYFYVNYTRPAPLETVIARYKVNNPATGVADPQSEAILFTFPQPFGNHNGGSIQFGPDGYLYIATGDGGSGGDPQNNAQNKGNLLGKVLRVDVNSTGKGNYGIPADNPFVGESGTREEIYAYGLRNPWKISFDLTTNQLWAADVGQNAREEIDIITKGGDYGWRRKEGTNCYNPSMNCQQTGTIEPVWEYGHSNGDRSITGGYVYRGKKLAGLTGKYIYGDYVSGRMWALETGNGTTPKNTLLTSAASSISSFGVDEQNELYFFNRQSGKLFTLTVSPN